MPYPPSRLVIRNVRVDGRRTSIRLEPELWDGLKEVCTREKWNQDAIMMVAQTAYRGSPLTSAVRSYVFNYFFEACMAQPRLNTTDASSGPASRGDTVRGKSSG